MTDKVAEGFKGFIIPLALACLALVIAGASAGPALAGADGGVLRVGVRGTGSQPSWWERTLTGAPEKGCIQRLMDMLEPLLDKKVEYVFCSTHVKRRRHLCSGRIDVIAFDSPQFTSDSCLDFISLGLHINRQLYVHKSRQDIFSTADLVGVRIAVVKGDNYMPHLNNALGSTIEPMGSPHQALEALNEGRVNAFLAPSARTAENIINQDGMHNVVKVGLTIERIQMNLAVRRDNPALKADLLEAVDELERSGQLKKIHERWYDVHYKPSLWRMILRLGLVAVTVAVLIILVVLVMNVRLKSRVTKVTRFLRASEERYRGLIDSAPDLVIVLDREGVIHHSNPVADQLMGKPGQSIVGAGLRDFVRPGDRDDLTGFIKQVFAQGHGQREAKLVDRTGSVRSVDVAARVLPATNGDQPRICCFARDVSQRKAIERELIQADRMSTIGKMAAGVAHEINNPIGIIQANVALLLTRNMYTPESLEFLEAIQRNSIRAGQITQDLLAMARPKTPEMRQVNLEELIRVSLGMLGGQLKGLEVVLEPPVRPPLMMGDPNLLQQVMVNLFLNAKSAMADSPTRRLLIRFCPNYIDDAVRLRIEDSGPGIDKPFLTEIFEPFFTSGKKEGFGLGLFISRLIIEKHDGMIFAESELGKGAHFIIELPAYNTGSDTGDNGAI